MPIARSACPLDCPDACSLEAHVEDGRLVSLDGSTANPTTAGFICAKVRAYGDLLYGADRVMHPRVRRGKKGSGDFEVVSWDEALTLVASRLDAARRDHGGESILPFRYGGSNGYLSHEAADARLFRRLGASRLLRTVCAAPSGAAATGLYGKMAGVAMQDYVHANLIIIWGANPTASGIHLIPFVQQAQKRGARLVVIDPRLTRTALRADMHLAPRPGTDLPLALSLINDLFERGAADVEFLKAHTTGWEELRRRAAAWPIDRAAETCGLVASEIETLARMYAETNPAVIRCGWGLERNRNGGSAIASVLALPAVAGKFGVRGGGYTMSNSSIWDARLEGAVNEPEPSTRALNMNHLGEDLLHRNDPPVKVLFVYNANPLMTIPAQEKVRAGLEREDLFTVVFDPVMTDTALYADVVLPATTFLERREMSKGYGAFVMQDAPAVVDPVGESRSNHEVFMELCRRLALSRPGDAETLDAWREAILRDTPHGSSLKASLDREGITAPPFGPSPIQFVDVHPRTADLKVHLCPEDLDREAPLGLYGFQPDPATGAHPLALISPSTERTISSSLGHLHRAQVPLEIHPDDARPRGIRTGDQVIARSAYGSVRCDARVTTDVRAGVVSLPKGIWSHNTRSGNTSNAVSPDTLSDIGAGACFNDARVEIERAPA